jgi:hypothetical protein
MVLQHQEQSQRGMLGEMVNARGNYFYRYDVPLEARTLPSCW